MFPGQKFSKRYFFYVKIYFFGTLGRAEQKVRKMPKSGAKKNAKSGAPGRAEQKARKNGTVRAARLGALGLGLGASLGLGAWALGLGA